MRAPGLAICNGGPDGVANPGARSNSGPLRRRLGISFGVESFDVVLCNHVLEHVDDYTRAMREILRVVLPGGYAILQ